MTDLRFDVAQIVDRPGQRRTVTGTLEVDVAVGDSRIQGPVGVEAVLEGIDKGVMARFRATANARLVCTRCLTEWDAEIGTDAIQIFEPEPDEDGYALEVDDTIDLAGPVRDEITLAVPLRPLCRADCAGLCPTCGTDLNRDPCGGHEEPASSPFAALQGLFDSPDQ